MGSDGRANEPATHRKDDCLEIPDVYDETCRAACSEECEQMWRDERDGRHLVEERRSSELERAQTGGELSPAVLTWRSSNRHRAIISLILVGRSGFSSTISLRDFGSVMRCLPRQEGRARSAHGSSSSLPPSRLDALLTLNKPV